MLFTICFHVFVSRNQQMQIYKSPSSLNNSNLSRAQELRIMNKRSGAKWFFFLRWKKKMPAARTGLSVGGKWRQKRGIERRVFTGSSSLVSCLTQKQLFSFYTVVGKLESVSNGQFSFLTYLSLFWFKCFVSNSNNLFYIMYPAFQTLSISIRR